jgi:hypothetical protein
MKTISTKVYTFDELSDTAKDKAREWYRECGFGYDWYDSVYDDAKTIGKILGITIDKIYFSGFSSQGDGACFEGRYEYAKHSVKLVKEYAPQDTTLHKIAEGLARIQRKNFYQLYAHVKHSGYYYHEFCTQIDVERDNTAMTDMADEMVKTFLRDFMHWIYSQLNKEWEYLNSNESVDDMMEVNEYTFTESGERFG